MPDSGKIEFVNWKEVDRAFAQAPKEMDKGIRRIFKRGATTFRNQMERRLFRGPPGIFIPSQQRVSALKGSQKGKRGKQSAGSLRKATARQHIRSKTAEKRGTFVLFSYLSKLATYHHTKLKRLFDGAFRRHARTILPKAVQEGFRLVKEKIEKGRTFSGRFG